MSDNQNLKPAGISNGKLLARLTPQNASYLKLVADTEDISLNEALNLVISRHHHYPKDLAEVHRQVQYCQGTLEVIVAQMELCQLHENQLINLIESGQVEERLQEIQDREDAAVVSRATPQTPTDTGLQPRVR